MKSHKPTRNAVLGVLGSAVVFSLPLSAVRADGGSDSAPASGQSPVAAMGATIAKDKQTGELRPATAKEIRQLQKVAAARQAETKAAQRPAKEPVVRQLPNGAMAITVDPSFDVSSVAIKGSDGKIHTTCVPNGQVAATLEKAQATVSKQKDILDEK